MRNPANVAENAPSAKGGPGRRPVLGIGFTGQPIRPHPGPLPEGEGRKSLNNKLYRHNKLAQSTAKK